jgi:hypothetical protein
MTEIRSKGIYQISRGEYGRYSTVVIELAKFQLTSVERYLSGFLEHINSLDGVPMEQPQSKENSVRGLTLPEIISILEELGHHIYYYSLSAHIMYASNDIGSTRSSKRYANTSEARLWVVIMK